MKILGLLQSVGCALLLMASLQAAHAYIPPSAYLLKTWVNRHSSIKLVRVRATITAFKEGKPTDVHFKETAFFGPGLATFKSYAQDDSGKKLFALDKGASAASVFTKLLLGGDILDLGRSLKEKGIPIRLEEDLLAMLTEEERIKSEVESLGRWKSALAWIVGQESQLWFQKDNFQPVRLIIPSETLGELIEVQMEDFGGAFSYPKTVTLLKKKSGEILLQSSLLDVINVSEAAIPNSIFAKDSSGNRAEVEAPQNLMELVRTYYNVLR